MYWYSVRSEYMVYWHVELSSPRFPEAFVPSSGWRGRGQGGRDQRRRGRYQGDRLLALLLLVSQKQGLVWWLDLDLTPPAWNDLMPYTWPFNPLPARDWGEGVLFMLFTKMFFVCKNNSHSVHFPLFVPPPPHHHHQTRLTSTLHSPERANKRHGWVAA